MASTYLSLYIHIVFSTRGRAPMIGSEWQQELHSYLGGTTRQLGAKPMIVGGTSDHIHLLASLKSTVSVSHLVQELKKSSSVWSAERLNGFRWQEGYAAFSVSASAVPQVTKYIANQETHHRSLSSDDELRSLLIEHEIEHDERFFE